MLFLVALKCVVIKQNLILCHSDFSRETKTKICACVLFLKYQRSVNCVKLNSNWTKTWLSTDQNLTQRNFFPPNELNWTRTRTLATRGTVIGRRRWPEVLKIKQWQWIISRMRCPRGTRSLICVHTSATSFSRHHLRKTIERRRREGDEEEEEEEEAVYREKGQRSDNQKCPFIGDIIKPQGAHQCRQPSVRIH